MSEKREMSDQELRAWSLLIAAVNHQNKDKLEYDEKKELLKYENLNNDTYVIMDFIKNGKD